MPLKLNLPSFEADIRTEGQSKQIFDRFRRKYVSLTPEEWVRQHMLNHMEIKLGFPFSLISVEQMLKVQGMQRRADIVSWDKDGKPLMVVECKAPDIKISQDVFDQAARYALELGIRFLYVTNGMEHFACMMDHQNKKYDFFRELPSFEELLEL